MKNNHMLILAALTVLLCGCNNSISSSINSETETVTSTQVVSESENETEQINFTAQNVKIDNETLLCEYNGEQLEFDISDVTLDPVNIYNGLSRAIVENSFDIPVSADITCDENMSKLYACDLITPNGSIVTNEYELYPVSCLYNILTVTKDNSNYLIDTNCLSENQKNDFCKDKTNPLQISGFIFKDSNKYVASMITQFTDRIYGYDESSNLYDIVDSYENMDNSSPYYFATVSGVGDEQISVVLNMNKAEIELVPTYTIGIDSIKSGDKICVKFTDEKLEDLTEKSFEWSVIKPSDNIKASVEKVRNFDGAEIYCSINNENLIIVPQKLTDENNNQIVLGDETSFDYISVSVSFDDIDYSSNTENSDGTSTYYYVKQCTLTGD